MSDADAISLNLTEDEWDVLAEGLDQWGGPASLSDSWAHALGFGSEQQFFEEADRLEESLAGRQPMMPRDWLRVIQATELVFISDSVGAGVEWSMVTRFTDAETVGLLRSIQEKFASAAYSA